jgi:hypothetical protein
MRLRARVHLTLINSRRKLPGLTLAIGFSPKGAELLTDFANTHPEGLEKRFVSKWREKTGLGWYSGTGREVGGEPNPLKVQQVVRKLWEGKYEGLQDQAIAQGLSLTMPRQEEGFVDTSQLLFHVNWKGGFIWASPRDLGDYVWLSLLQHSQRLAVCENKENGCPSPYFIRKKKGQKFCSEECAAPSQREFKRKWFREHGEEWRKQRMKKHQKQLKSTRKKRG